jgi:hypothetical protein
MKLFRKLKLLVLIFAVVAMVLGFSVFTAPNTATASKCTAWCMYCMEIPPYWCWCQCCGW